MSKRKRLNMARDKREIVTVSRPVTKEVSALIKSSANRNMENAYLQKRWADREHAVATHEAIRTVSRYLESFIARNRALFMNGGQAAPFNAGDVNAIHEFIASMDSAEEVRRYTAVIQAAAPDAHPMEIIGLAVMESQRGKQEANFIQGVRDTPEKLTPEYRRGFYLAAAEYFRTVDLGLSPRAHAVVAAVADKWFREFVEAMMSAPYRTPVVLEQNRLNNPERMKRVMDGEETRRRRDEVEAILKSRGIELTHRESRALAGVQYVMDKMGHEPNAADGRGYIVPISAFLEACGERPIIDSVGRHKGYPARTRDELLAALTGLSDKRVPLAYTYRAGGKRHRVVEPSAQILAVQFRASSAEGGRDTAATRLNPADAFSELDEEMRKDERRVYIQFTPHRILSTGIPRQAAPDEPAFFAVKDAGLDEEILRWYRRESPKAKRIPDTPALLISHLITLDRPDVASMRRDTAVQRFRLDKRQAKAGPGYVDARLDEAFRCAVDLGYLSAWHIQEGADGQPVYHFTLTGKVKRVAARDERIQAAQAAKAEAGGEGDEGRKRKRKRKGDEHG